MEEIYNTVSSLTRIRDDYKLIKKGQGWLWGPRNTPKIEIQIEKETLSIKSISDKKGVVQLSKDEFNHFCFQLKRSGNKIFKGVSTIESDVSRHGLGLAIQKENGHIGNIAINEAGAFVSLSDEPCFVTNGDFSLTKDTFCPMILIVKGCLRINGDNGGLGVLSLYKNDISCESLIISGQNVCLPEKSRISYQNLAIEYCGVHAPGGLPSDIGDIRITDASVMTDTMGTTLHASGVAKFEKARFSLVTYNDGIRISSNSDRKISFPFRGVEAGQALVMRNGGSGIEDDVLITTRKFYPDRNKKIGYVVEDVEGRTIRDIMDNPPIRATIALDSSPNNMPS